VAVVDYYGGIIVWENSKILTELSIRSMAELSSEYRSKLYFTMEYPYYIYLEGKYIAFSSDYGVLVLEDNTLE
jgi:hypothetical protein